MTDADWVSLANAAYNLLAQHTFPPAQVRIEKVVLLTGMRFVCTPVAPLSSPVDVSLLRDRLVDVGVMNPRIEVHRGGTVVVTVRRPSAERLKRWGSQGCWWLAKLVASAALGSYLVSLALSHPA